MRQLALDIASPSRPTLENFVSGRNAELVVVLYALSTNASSERFVHLWGEEGSGKTHLLHAVVENAGRNGVRTAWFDAGAADYAGDSEVLFVADDVERLDASAQIALFNLYNRLGGGVSGGLVTAGNAAPAGLTLRADLVTRLGSGLVYQVHGLNDEEKAAALRHHADSRGFQLSPDVANYLLRHSQRDMSSLIALLDALDRHALAAKRAITVPLLREVLLATAPPAAAQPGPGTSTD